MVDVLLPQATTESPSRRTSSTVGVTEEQLLSSQSAEAVDSTAAAANQLGRAEACGALCRVLCSHRTGEHVLPVYLSRFYQVIDAALDLNQPGCAVLCSVLLNGQNLLKSDLPGAYVLVPRVLAAVELVLQAPQPKLKGYDPVLIPIPELRRAAIHLVMSILGLPLHFNGARVAGFCAKSTDTAETFEALKPRLGDLLLTAIISEVDPTNIQMLLGCLMFLIQDMATFEESTDSDNEVSERKRESSGTRGRGSARLPECASELLEQSVHLLCQRLLHSWRLDTQTALAALELLAALPRLSCATAAVGRQAVRWLCAYIERLCGAPKQQHSRDLHSLIVCAFSTVSLWLIERPAILAERDTLHDVMETVELGISGDKSQLRASDAPRLKAEKQLMPASKRVMDSAELCLNVIMDHVGSYPPPCGPESTTSLLSEQELLFSLAETSIDTAGTDAGTADVTSDTQGSHVKYYAVDNSLIVGLLEQPLGPKQEGQPWLTAVIRGPNGRHVWTLRQRHVPLSTKLSSREVLCEPPRPEPDTPPDVVDGGPAANFPLNLDDLPTVSAECSIPTLEGVVESKTEHAFWRQLIASQHEQEQRAVAQAEGRAEREAGNECRQPELVTEFQTARLFLSQLGLLTLDSCKERTSSTAPPSLALLDSSHADFFHALRALDSTSARSVDTVAVCLVKAGQTKLEHILANVEHVSAVPDAFQQLLRSLGWPVDVHQHCGWAGQKPHPDGKPPPISSEDLPANSGGALYDGRARVLYWANVHSELAFIVPSLVSLEQHAGALSPAGPKSPTSSQTPVGSTNNLDSSGSTNVSVKNPAPSRQALSLDLAPGTTGNMKRVKSGGAELKGTQTFNGEVKVVIAWLEDYQDMEFFPAEEVARLASTGGHTDTGAARSSVVTLFLHPLQCGLLRVHVQGSVMSKSMSVGPLLSGMVVSARAVPSLLRHTVLNLYRRRRLYTDGQAPQVRRKMGIQEIVHKFRLKLSEPDFFTALFQKN